MGKKSDKNSTLISGTDTIKARESEVDKSEIKKLDIATVSDLAVNVELIDETLYSELELAASRLGMDVGTYTYRTIKRVFEKVALGMSLDVAATRAGIPLSDLNDMAMADAGLRDMYYALRHRFDMNVMGAVMGNIGDGDGRLALDVLSRQSGDFVSSAKKVEVSGVIDLRSGMVE